MRLFLFCSLEFIVCLVGYNLDSIKREFTYFMEMKKRGRRWLKYNQYELRDEMDSWKQDRRHDDPIHHELEKQNTRYKNNLAQVV